MKNRIESFKTRRTEIISEMLDNPDGAGIYPTSKCYEDLDKLFESLLRGACVEFGAEYGYRKANPESKMDVPSIVYEDAERFYDRNFKKKEVADSDKEKRYWEIISKLGWGTKTTDYNMLKELISTTYKVDAEGLKDFVDERRKNLVSVLNRSSSGHGYHVGDDGFWDLTAHIVGLGKDKYNEVIINPEIAKKMGKSHSYKENFQYSFNE